MIGVVGAGGAVGRVVTARLAMAGHQVRAGARKPAELAAVPPGGSPVDRVPVDIDDPATLRRFCEGCAVVVNCAGPAVRIGARVAAAATATGADYVDAAGDATLAAAVSEVCGDRRAVLSAGLSPGLSELLPRYFAGRLPVPPRRLTGWHASRDRFAPAAAADYLAATAGDFGVAGGAWRDGAVVATEAAPVATARVPFVPDPVTLFAYLPAAAVRIAHELELAALDWFNGFAGEHVVRALAAGGDPEGAVQLLLRAAELDLFGGEAYQILVLRAEDRTGGVRGLVVHGRDASRITGEVAAYAAEVVLRGQVPAGVQHAGFALDPGGTVDALLAAGALVSVVPIDGDPCADDATEDGAL